MSAKLSKVNVQVNQVWKIVLLIILVPIVVIAYAKVFSSGCSFKGGSEGTLGERITTRLSKDVNGTGQKLEFEPHLVSIRDYNLEEDWIEIGVGCFFKNLGSDDLSLNFKDDVRVEDRSGRRFSISNQMFSIERTTGNNWFTTIGPGFEERRMLQFKLPEDSFRGDLYLGFPKKGDGDGKMLAKMKIYDARSSDFAIGAGGTFYTEDWDVDD